nr:hypothetical protein [Tanacetum cinerariifolium]
MLGNVARVRETIGTTVVKKSGIQCYNCKEFGHVARECQKLKRVKDAAYHREKMLLSRECQKLKRVKDAAYHREKMLLCKQEEAGIQLNAEQADWRDDTDDESEDQELEAHYMYMEQIQEVSLDAANNSGPIFDSEPLKKVSNDENYNVFAIESEHPEQSKSVHDTYPIEKDEHNTNELMYNDLKKFEAELDKVIALENKVKKKEMVADLRYFNSLKPEVDSLKSQLETQKTQFLNEILGVYTELDEHDMCVLKSRNGVNSRTKMPIAVPISTREPKRSVKQFVAKPLRKTVASESTNQKPRHTTGKLYEHVSLSKEDFMLKDGENLDKMKEKGDACIFVGYSTQSRAYRVFNKRTRVIVESIHVNFDELPHMASDHVSSDPVPQCQKTALEHDSLSPGPLFRTRHQLESDGKMCMFALTVSRTEPKNIKEAMADSAWIESMPEELYKFDQLDVAVNSSLRLLKLKVQKLSLETRRDPIINLIRTQSMYNTCEDGNPARANIKQALG